MLYTYIRDIRAVASLLILAGIQFASTTGSAQPERLRMSDAVREAIEANPQLRAARYDLPASRADRVTADLRPNPSLTVNADILPSQGLGPADKNYGISLNFPFELGGKRTARVSAAEAAIEVTVLELADQIRQTIAATRDAYFDLVGSEEKARAATENLALLDSLVMLSKIRVADNDIARVELTRSEVEREKFGLEVVRTKEEHRAAMVRLQTLMGRPEANSGWSIRPDSGALQMVMAVMQHETFPLDSLLAIADTARQDLQALRAQEHLAQLTLELQKSLATIDLNVSLDFMRSQGITFYGSTLSVPLLIYNQNQGEIEKAAIKFEQARVQTAAARMQMRAEISNAWYDAETKRHALQTLGQDVLQKARSVRNAIEYSYTRGGTSLVDYLDAARTYNELQQDYVEALQSYAKSLVTLNLVTGKDLYYDGI